MLNHSSCLNASSCRQAARRPCQEYWLALTSRVKPLLPLYAMFDFKLEQHDVLR